MKIAIVSDIHDNQVNLKKCLGWLEKEEIKGMIYCGDITNNETLDILAKGFPGKIYLVKGPGTLGAMFMRATFGTWDSETGKLELKILDEL
jgi:hypothetical protein